MLKMTYTTMLWTHVLYFGYFLQARLCPSGLCMIIIIFALWSIFSTKTLFTRIFFCRYGGLPRFTLEKFDDVREISSSVLRSAISLAGVEDMEHYVTLNYKPSSVLNRVFHINAYNQLDRPIPRFASKLIAGMFVQAKDLDKQLR